MLIESLKVLIIAQYIELELKLSGYEVQTRDEFARSEARNNEFKFLKVMNWNASL
jgi:hypothetical protein